MKVLPYIIAMFAGLFARTIAASLGGIEGYTMDGHDFLLMLLAIVAVWSFKGAFMPKRKRASGRDNRR